MVLLDKVYVKTLRPELLLMGMRFASPMRLCQAISASSLQCERNWAALAQLLEDPQKAEPLQSLSPFIQTAKRSQRCQRIRGVWDNEDSSAITRRLQNSALGPGARGPGPGPGKARVAESSSRESLVLLQVSRVAESRVAAPRLGATRPALGSTS